ncbi:MAG TPA: hypothetical protein VMV52_06210, partial [Candidatus Nanopelagicaceae bacterium]|nr:hypothetical protein [Candidatus Nanopelagicaceae bacterium]
MANAKTMRRRISLVAAAALGVGMLAAAPAFATSTALTMTLGTVTPSVPVTGTAVRIPVLLANTATGTDTSGTATYKVTVHSVPNDSAIVTGAASTSFTSDITGLAAGIATGLITMTAPTNALLATVAASSTTFTALAAGGFSFTPDVPGAYDISIVSTLSAVTSTETAVAHIIINVGGAAATQATGGKGAASAVTGQTGGNVTINYVLPATTAAGTVYTAVASGQSVIAAGSGTANLAASTYAQTGSSGITKVNGVDYAAGAKYTSQNLITQAVLTASAKTEMFTTTVTSSVAGTATLTISTVNSSTGAVTTVKAVTVTWGAAPAWSLANSTAILTAGTASAGSTDATVAASKSAAQVANVTITLKDQFSNAINGETLSATVSGPGLIAFGSTTTQVGTARAVSSTLTSTNLGYLGISADGTAGVSTITISDGTTVIATKTVTFYGAVATFTPTNVTTVNKVGTNTGSVTVVAKDAAGNIIPSISVYATSGTTATATIAASATTDSTGTATFDLTGVAAGTSVLTFGDASTSPTVTATSTVTVSGGVGTTVTLTFDKASYAPGDKAVLTLTVKDASGNAVADGAYTSLFTGDLAASTSLGGASLTGSGTPTLTGGVKSWTVYAPLTAGPFSVNGTTGTGSNLVTAAQSVALSAAATVTSVPNADVAAAKASADAATAAANAATAAVATLSTTVASLVASITAQIRALN